MISIAKPRPTTCWFCEKPNSAHRTRPDGRAACAPCEGFMQQGVICIGVSVELEPDALIDKIYRDGNWCILSCAEYERRFRSVVPALRFAFITGDAWRKAFLPRFGKHGASHVEQTNLVPEDLEALSDDAEATTLA